MLQFYQILPHQDCNTADCTLKQLRLYCENIIGHFHLGTLSDLLVSAGQGDKILELIRLYKQGQ